MPSVLSFFISALKVVRHSSRLTARVAVEGETVGGAAGDAGEDVGGGEVLDAVAQSDAAGEALEATEVGSKTGNVRRGFISSSAVRSKKAET